MPRQPIFIPLSKGLDQKLDERLRQPDSLAQATNAYYKRGGALTKRHGFGLIQAGGVTLESGVRGILSSGEELLVRGARSLWALVERNASLSPFWTKKGALAPFTGAERPMFSDALSIPSCDTAHIAGYAIHAATTLRYVTNTSASGFATSLVYKIEAEQGPNEVKGTALIVVNQGANVEIGAARVVVGSAAGEALRILASSGLLSRRCSSTAGHPQPHKPCLRPLSRTRTCGLPRPVCQVMTADTTRCL